LQSAREEEWEKVAQWEQGKLQVSILATDESDCLN